MVKKKTKKDESITTLDIAKENIKKEYGNVLKKMSDIGKLVVPTVSTGSLGLDVALGRGGLARGRVYEIYGPPSGGKTSLAISTIVEAQKRNLRCLFVDIEHAADTELFENMGVDTEALETITTGEDYAIIDGEDYIKIAEGLIKSGGIDLVVFDSITALLPKQESEADIDADFYALLARLMSKTLRRFIHIISRTNTLLIFINQMRDKMNAWGNPEKTTGGNALPFYATGRIRVEGGETTTSRISDSNGVIIGHTTKFEIKKNKLAPPYRTHEINLIYGQGYDKVGEAIELAASIGVIEKSGSWYSYKDKNLAQGIVNVKVIFEEDKDLYSEVVKSLIERIGLKVFYEQNS